MRILITSASLFTISWHHGGVDDIAGQVGLLLVVAVLVFDIVHARRELAAVAGSAAAPYVALADRELTYLGWAELTEYLAAFAVAIRLVHRSLDAFQYVAIVALLAAGFFVRFGLARSARSMRERLRAAAEVGEEAVFPPLAEH